MVFQRADHPFYIVFMDLSRRLRICLRQHAVQIMRPFFTGDFFQFPAVSAVFFCLRKINVIQHRLDIKSRSAH